MRLIIFGAPGVGKGTQSDIIAQTIHIPHISTGQIFRDHISNGTELGKKIQKYLDNGLLVPDDLTIGVIRERIKEKDCTKGFILDGFPRTIAQAESLDNMLIEENLKIDKVLNIHLEDQKIIERLSGRLTCSSCNAIYHIKYNPPKQKDRCDICGSVLLKRKDDEEETIKKRLQVYHAQTEEVILYYKIRNLVVDVESKENLDDTTREIFAKLQIKKKE